MSIPESLADMPGSGVLDFSQESITGQRLAIVDKNDLAEAVIALMGIVIIDPTGKEVRIGADPFPGWPMLRVHKVGAVPISPGIQASSWASGPQFESYKLSIDYAVPQYDEEDEQEEKPEDITYSIQSLDYSCEVLVVPVKVTGAKYGGGTSTRVTQRHIRIPTITYTITFPKVKKPKWSKIAELNGKVNTVTLFGGAPGTVLFDGPHLEREVKSDGGRAWKVTFKFIYQRNGWNKTLHPETLKWVDVTALDGSADLPYLTADLKQLFPNEVTV